MSGRKRHFAPTAVAVSGRSTERVLACRMRRPPTAFQSSKSCRGPSPVGFCAAKQGLGRAMRQLLETAKRARARDSKVLITGETGVGKMCSADDSTPRHRARRVGSLPSTAPGSPKRSSKSELFGARQRQSRWSLRRQAWKARAGERRHHIPGRGRRDDAADAGVAAPLFGKREVRPVRSDTLHVASTRESSQPPIAISTHDRSWNLSRRFALPNPRCASACAAAARARGGYPAAADALHRADRSESDSTAYTTGGVSGQPE